MKTPQATQKKCSLMKRIMSLSDRATLRGKPILIIVTKEAPTNKDAPGTRSMLIAARGAHKKGAYVYVTSLQGLKQQLLPFQSPETYPAAFLYDAKRMLIDTSYDATGVSRLTISPANVVPNKSNRNNMTNTRIATQIYALVQSKNPPSKRRRKMILLVRGIVPGTDRSLNAFRRIVRLARRRKRAQVAIAEVTTAEAPSSLRSAIQKTGGNPFAVVLDLQQISMHDYLPTLQGIFETPQQLANLRYHYARTKL